MLIGSVYIMHIDPKYAGSQHYIGFSREWMIRTINHSHGRGGSKTTGRAYKAGCTIKMMCAWHDVPSGFEQYVKARFRPHDCPWCWGASPDLLEKYADDYARNPNRYRKRKYARWV